MIYNSATPMSELDPPSIEVGAVGARQTCEPATDLQLARRHFLV